MSTIDTYLYSQESFIFCSDSTYCVPGIAGAPRPKGLIIQQENLLDYRIKTTSDQGSSNKIDVNRNKRWLIKARFPVINKTGFKFAMGVSYYVEKVEVGDIGSSGNSLFDNLYKNLDEKSLKSLKTTYYFSKPFLGNKYLLSRISISFNGDYSDKEIPLSDVIRQSYALLYGVKLSPSRSVAFGVNLSNNFGKFGVIPIVSYNASWNNHWLLESLLPLNIKLNYLTANKKNVLFVEAKAEGGNYKLFFEEPVLSFNKLLLRKSEIQFSLNYEREIHDWLWFGVEAGLRTNLEFDLAESAFDSNSIVDNDIRKSLVTSVTLFVVPPRKFFN